MLNLWNKELLVIELYQLWQWVKAALARYFENLTGSRQLSGKSILNYYAPLKEWLDDQNKNRTCGWSKNEVVT